MAPDVIAALARGCRGGLRDAESMLDQAISIADGRVTLDDLEMVAGLARPERWLDLFEAIAEDRPADLLRVVADFLNRGGTERDLVEQAADALRDLLHVALIGEDALGVEPEPARRNRMRALAKLLGRDRLEAILGMLFELEARLQRSPLASRALLEWTLLRAARLSALLDLAALADSLQAQPLGSAPPPRPARPAVAPATVPTTAAAPTPVPKAPPLAPAAVSDIPTLMELLKAKRPALASALRRHWINGEIRGSEVWVELQEPPARDRAILEDPAEQTALARLPGSPGPWRLTFMRAAQEGDALGRRLIESFDGREEEP